jgi:hypothetical protein
MTDDRTLERAARSWLEEGPTRAPARPVEAALASIQRTRQERGFPASWRFDRMNTAIRLAGIAVVAIAAVGLGSVALNPPGPGGPVPGQATPRPAPSTNDVPVVPESPLPDPAGSGLPASLIGRTYRADPPETTDGPQLVLTLRGADDGHCTAMYAGRSTCFTLLWVPFKSGDPGARGAARIVDGNLMLSFDIVPFDEPCVGMSAAYTIEEGGAGFRVVGDAACAFEAFVEVP